MASTCKKISISNLQSDLRLLAYLISGNEALGRGGHEQVFTVCGIGEPSKSVGKNDSDEKWDDHKAELISSIKQIHIEFQVDVVPQHLLLRNNRCQFLAITFDYLVQGTVDNERVALDDRVTANACCQFKNDRWKNEKMALGSYPSLSPFAKFSSTSGWSSEVD